MSKVFTALALVAILFSPRAMAATKSSSRPQANQPTATARSAEKTRATNNSRPSAKARPTQKARVSEKTSPTARARARLVASARRHLGKPFRGDCSGFVRRVYAAAGVPLPSPVRARSGTESIVRSMAPAKRPRPGDIAYFHRTHDRDPPGRGRNLFTHIAVVESVDGPRVTIIHRSNRGVERLQMHLTRRADPKVNGALRRRKANDPPTQPYLASQLLAGFASPFKAAQVQARRPAVARGTQR